jgi:hypothetical protein
VGAGPKVKGSRSTSDMASVVWLGLGGGVGSLAKCDDLILSTLLTKVKLSKKGMSR